MRIWHQGWDKYGGRRIPELEKFRDISAGYHPFRGFGARDLRNRIRTNRASLALLAELAEMQPVDPVHQFAEMPGIVGQHACLEIVMLGDKEEK